MFPVFPVLMKNVPVMLRGCRARRNPSAYWFSMPSSNVSETMVVNLIAWECGCSVLPAVEHGPPLQEFAVTGGVVSGPCWILTAWACAASAFPALSQDRYWMV